MPAAGMITRSMKAKRHSDARNSHESPSMTCSGQREIGNVLLLVMLDKERRVLKEVVDAATGERTAHREDYARIASRRSGGVGNGRHACHGTPGSHCKRFERSSQV